MTHTPRKARLRLAAVNLLALALLHGGLCAPRALTLQDPPQPPGGGGPAGPVDYTRVFKTSEVTKRAAITSKPDPGYTEEARKNDVEGVVRLRVVLEASGKVTNINVVKALPDGLTERAISAAKQVGFTPAERDGRKVSQYAVLDYNFIAAYMHESDVDERAVILEKPPAGYTVEARLNGVSGKVVLKIALAGFGAVKVISVTQGLPHGLTEKAVEAAGLIKFNPARLGGRAVTQITTVEYLFAP